MPNNIEIKASVAHPEEVHKLAKEICDKEAEVLEQEDIFFKVQTGRLKMRKIQGKHEELIYYLRSDETGPTISSFTKVDRPPGELSTDMKELLTKALGIVGSVIKKRTLYMVGQTRVHVDEVKDLGSYMELEVMMQEGQTEDECKGIALEIMDKLKIRQDDLIEKAYIDLICDKD